MPEQSSELVEISKLNGDFEKQLRAVVGRFSLSALHQCRAREIRLLDIDRHFGGAGLVGAAWMDSPVLSRGAKDALKIYIDRRTQDGYMLSWIKELAAHRHHKTASTRPKVFASCASRYQFDGAFSKTSCRVTLEPLTRLAKPSF